MEKEAKVAWKVCEGGWATARSRNSEKDRDDAKRERFPLINEL